MRKREIAARTLGYSPVRWLWRSAGGGTRGLRILAYHRVLDDAPATFPFDEDLISATSINFRRQMKFVKRHFEVLSFADLYRCAQENKPWPQRALIVTFDDGYADNYTHAFPILKEQNVPATIFLATGFMESGLIFWWDLVAYCFKHTQHRSVHLPEIASEPLQMPDALACRHAINAVLQWMKHAPDAARRDFLERLPAALSIELADDLGRDMHLSWAQVREMAEHGIEFGGHSVTHPILTNVAAEELAAEIGGSKQKIESCLGRESLVFCYPAGLFNAKVQDAVRHAGFHFATAFHEAISHPSLDRYALPRIHVEHEDSFALFQSNLMFPGLMLRGNSTCEIS